MQIPLPPSRIYADQLPSCVETMTQAIMDGDLDVVKTLLENPSHSVLRQRSGHPPYFHYDALLIQTINTGHIDTGHIAIAKWLLENGANPNYRDPTTKATALMHAAHHDDPTMLILILQNSANPDITDAQGQHIWYQALKCGQISNALKLLEYSHCQRTRCCAALAVILCGIIACPLLLLGNPTTALWMSKPQSGCPSLFWSGVNFLKSFCVSPHTTDTSTDTATLRGSIRPESPQGQPGHTSIPFNTGQEQSTQPDDRSAPYTLG